MTIVEIWVLCGHSSKICSICPKIMNKNNYDNLMILIGPNCFEMQQVGSKLISVLVYKFQFTVSLFKVWKSPLINATDPE